MKTNGKWKIHITHFDIGDDTFNRLKLKILVTNEKAK